MVRHFSAVVFKEFLVIITAKFFLVTVLVYLCYILFRCNVIIIILLLIEEFVTCTVSVSWQYQRHGNVFVMCFRF